MFGGPIRFWTSPAVDLRNKTLPANAAKAKKDALLTNATCHSDEALLYEFAILAQQLGFTSDRIHNLILESPDHQIARCALL